MADFGEHRLRLVLCAIRMQRDHYPSTPPRDTVHGHQATIARVEPVYKTHKQNAELTRRSTEFCRKSTNSPNRNQRFHGVHEENGVQVGTLQYFKQSRLEIQLLTSPHVVWHFLWSWVNSTPESNGHLPLLHSIVEMKRNADYRGPVPTTSDERAHPERK